MTTIKSALSAGADEDSSTFPTVRHRPPTALDPVDPKTLAPIRAALLNNPDVNLPSEAAGLVTGGTTEPSRFRMLTEPYTSAAGVISSLLTAKRVSDGTTYMTPQHQRYLDIGILPDPIGARWTHTLSNRLDVEPTGLGAAAMTTATGEDGRPWAMLELEVTGYDELAARVREAFRHTNPDTTSTQNDYTDSILASGVKEPLALAVMRVTFTDGTPEAYFLVAIDGNSRLVSAWKGRTGGSVDDAASACIAAVIGTKTGTKSSTAWRRVTQRQARKQLELEAAAINKGLTETRLTEATIRSGQTFTVPAVVLVGGVDTSGNPLPDLVAARADLIATLHTDVTPWSVGAQADQGMTRLLRKANRDKLIDDDAYSIITGQRTVAQMNRLLGLPPHRLWAVALTLQAVLNPWYDGMGARFKEEFNVVRPTRLTIGRQIAPTALSGYRSSNLSLALNAFADGGPITQTVWDTHIRLTTGNDAVEVLTTILATAMTGPADERKNAVVELSLLGGSAAIIDSLLTRDRGSKATDDGVREAGKVPLRARPYRIIEALAGTVGGLRTLWSLAVAHVTGEPAKQYWTVDDPQGRYVDGDPVLDAAGAHKSIALEWDLVLTAEPRRSAEAIAAARADGTGSDGEPDDVLARRSLTFGVITVDKAIEQLKALSRSSGKSVWGSYDAVEGIRARLQNARDELGKYGPPAPGDDEPDELDWTGQGTADEEDDE